MLITTHDNEEIIERVAALDIGKAELMCCVRGVDPPYPGRSCETQRMPRSAAAANSGSGGAPAFGVPCCQKTASSAVPSPVPVPVS